MSSLGVSRTPTPGEPLAEVQPLPRLQPADRGRAPLPRKRLAAPRRSVAGERENGPPLLAHSLGSRELLSGTLNTRLSSKRWFKVAPTTAPHRPPRHGCNARTMLTQVPAPSSAGGEDVGGRRTQAHPFPLSHPCWDTEWAELEG